MQQHISINELQGYLSCVEQTGVDPYPLLRICGIDPQMLVQLEGYINYSQFNKLLELTATKTNCPYFGLLLSQKRELSHTDTLGLYLEKCMDIRSAFFGYIKYAHVHSQAIVLELIEDNDLAIVNLTILTNQSSTMHHIDLIFGSLTQWFQMVTGKRIIPTKYYFSHDGDKNNKIYQQLLGTAVAFNHDTNTVVLDRSLLNTPLQGYHQTTKDILQHHLESLSLDMNKDIVTIVRNMISKLLPQGFCTRDIVAKQLLVSPSKLNYLLSGKNTSFKELVELTRKNIAKQQLLQSNMSLTQLTDILSYSSQATFTRAFKSWFGLTPNVWKKQQLL